MKKESKIKHACQKSIKIGTKVISTAIEIINSVKYFIDFFKDNKDELKKIANVVVKMYRFVAKNILTA